MLDALASQRTGRRARAPARQPHSSALRGLVNGNMDAPVLVSLQYPTLLTGSRRHDIFPDSPAVMKPFWLALLSAA
jgi:hypothetical protein